MDTKTLTMFLFQILLGLATAAGGFIAKLLWNELLRHKEHIAKLYTQMQETQVKHEQFKTEVANNYPRTSALDKLEDRIREQIEKLGDKLDRFLEKNNGD